MPFITYCNSAAEERSPAPYTFIWSPSLKRCRCVQGFDNNSFDLPAESKLNGEEIAGN